MANLYANLPVPVGNGTGAAVNTTAYGQIRTITVQGDFVSTITIEFSLNNVDWYPLFSLSQSGKKTVNLAAAYMRVRQSGYVQGTPNVDLGGDDAGGDYVALAVPAGDGVGAAVDVSAFGTFNTVVISGTYTGTVLIEISEDNTVWAQKMAFNGPVAWKSAVFVARYMRVRRVGTDPLLAGTGTCNVGAIRDPSSSLAWQGALTYVLRPGGVQANNVYDNWPDLYADIIQVEGLRQILFDDTIAPITIPAGTYDMQGVRWVGEKEYGALGTVDQVVINIAEQCVLNHLRDFYGPMIVNNQATTQPPCQDMSDNDIITLRGGVIINSENAISFYCTTNLGAGDYLFVDMDRQCAIGMLDENPVFEIDNVGTQVLFRLGEGCVIGPNSLDHPIGSTFEFDYRGIFSQVYLEQTNALGTLLDTSHQRHRYDITAQTSQYEADIGELVRCNANGGTFQVDLPPISTAGVPSDERTHGGWVVIKEIDGTNPITVDCDAADTIDGAAGPVTCPPGGSLILVSDGVSDWMTIAINRETMLNQANNFTASQGSAAIDLVDEANFETDCSLGNYFRLTATADRAMDTPDNPVAGHTYMWRFVSSGAGRVITFPAAFKFPNGAGFTTGTGGAGSVDIVTAAYNGTNFDCVGQPNMS